MEENEIRKYAGIMDEFGLTGIEVSRGGNVVRLEKINNDNYSDSKTYNKDERIIDVNKRNLESDSEEKNDIVEITSPIIGAFYISPGDDMEPYVKKGDKIKKGEVLCVIESMKLMNEITSEFDGIIHEVCAINGQDVDYGYPLFKIMVN